MNGDRTKQNQKTTAYVAAAAAALLGAGALLYFDPLHLRGDPMTLSCEDILKDRLKAPSLYHRISASDVQTSKASFEDYMGWTDDPERKAQETHLASTDKQYFDLWSAKQKDYYLADQWEHQILIEYDAPNSYGTPIRAEAICSFINQSKEARFSKLDAISLKVDGFSKLDWALKGLREATGR